MAAHDQESQGNFWLLRLGVPGALGVRPATFTPAGFATNNTMEQSIEMAQIVNKNYNGGSAKRPGTETWTMGFEGHYVPSNAGQTAIKNAIAAQRANGAYPYWVQFLMVNADLTPTTGAPLFEGTAWVSSRSVASPADDITTLSVTFDGTGVLAESVTPA